MRALALAIVAASACGGEMAHVATDGTPLVGGFNPPGPPSDGIQLVSPVIARFPAGGNQELCYWTKTILSSETAFRGGQGFQAPGGHHAVVYWTKVRQPEQIRECTEADMVNLHVLTGGGAESGNGIVNGLPAGTAFHVPAGAQLVLNVHVLNASAKAVDTQAAVNLFYGAQDLAPVSSFYVTGTSMTIPVGQTVSYSAGCTMPKAMKAVRLLGHMHEWGTRMQIAVNGQVVYDRPGSNDFSFNPPFIDYPVAAPVSFAVGDKVTATCTWNNTTTHDLAFPDEMCAAFGYVLGNDPEAGCADGSWNN